jgi:membrane-associated phospholipid phosphatase
VNVREAVEGTDERVARWARTLPTALRPLMWIATLLGYPAVQAALLVTVSFLVPAGDRWVFLVAAATLVVPTVLKHTWKRARPQSAYVEGMVMPSPSFPSGHAFSAVVALGLLAWYSLGHVDPLAFGIVVALLLLLWGFVISLSRLYFEAHYPSDVFGGWLIALLVLTVILVVFRP